MFPARLRAGQAMGGGLLVHSPRCISQAGTVELRRGDYVICARVMWRDGTRTGLQCDEQLPVEQIMSLDLAGAPVEGAEQSFRRAAQTAQSGNRSAAAGAYLGVH